MSFDDGSGEIVEKTVNINVTSKTTEIVSFEINIPSVISTDENQSATILYSSVNPQSTLNVTLSSSPSKGDVTINNGAVTYTPNSGYYGEDNFSLEFDNSVETIEKTISVYINKGSNTLPDIMRLQTIIELDQDTNKTLDFYIVDNDGDSVITTTKSTPSNGSIIINANNSITYVPDSGYYGKDSFILEFDDQNGGLVEKKVTANIAQVETPDENSTSLNLNAGWNLVAFPVDTNITNSELSTTFADTSAIWKYINGGWEAHGITDTIQALLDSAGIPDIETLSKGEGFWVSTALAKTIEFSGETYDITTLDNLTNTSSGWHMIGSGSNLSVSDIVDANSNIKTIWSYGTSGWKAYSPNSSTQSVITNAGIETLSNINKGMGFWINVD